MLKRGLFFLGILLFLFSCEESEPTNEELMVEAINNGDTVEVARLIAEGVDLNYMVPGNGCNKPLMTYAYVSGEPECGNLIVEAGANVDLRNSPGPTAIFNASCQGRSDDVSFLIAHGADVNLTVTWTTGSVTALDRARANGHTDIEAMLIAAGAVE